jgi:hypothetical protein
LFILMGRGPLDARVRRAPERVARHSALKAIYGQAM